MSGNATNQELVGSVIKPSKPLDPRFTQSLFSRVASLVKVGHGEVALVQRILAIGGGGFQVESDPSPIDTYILQLTGKSKPRICLVATMSGDLPEYIEKFYSAFPSSDCEPSHLAFFFRDPRPGAVALGALKKHVLGQDVIFVSGGSARAGLAVWREWQVDRVFAEAHHAGVLLSGVSSGVMCWFASGLTDTYWEPGYRPLPCLGLIPGG
jgi:dipeptidase E